MENKTHSQIRGQKFNFYKKLNFFLLILSVLAMGLVPAPRGIVPQGGAALPAGQGLSAGQAELIQMKSAGHILGFQPGQAYMAAMDHLLSVEFAGAAGVRPVQGQGAVTYTNLWRGVDVIYQTVVDGVAKTTYTVAPGADPRQIRLRYNLPVAIQPDGSLRIGEERSSVGTLERSNVSTGYMTESAPVAWQDIGGRRVAVDVAFVVNETGADSIRPYNAVVGAHAVRPGVGVHQVVSFHVGRYDPRYPLVIDPTYAWHTFYGVKPVFEGTAIAADDSGNTYVVGNVTSEFYYNNFSISPELDYHGGSDIVAIKYNASGQPQWYTFLGGVYQDYGTGVAVGGSKVYVVGYSSASWDGRDFNGFPISPLHAFTPGYSDAVIISLGASSGGMYWHTFYGSDNIDDAQGVTVLSDNSLVVVGSSYDTWKGPANQNPLHAFTGQYDISDIMALNLSASGAYQWHTFYGSTSHDYGRAVSRSSSDTIYIAANSNASWKNGTTDPLHAHSGGSEITALALSSAGAYSWHTFYGSSGSDAATAILADSSRSRVYVAGYSASTWNADATAPLHAHSGGSDVFALSLGTGGGYVWHTFYGSDRTDEAYGVALIPLGMGSIVIVGRSEKTWNGASNQPPEHAYSGSWDLFALRMYYDGAYEWHTFYGSTARENAAAAVYQSSAGLALTGYGEDAWPDYSTVKHYSGQNILRLGLTTAAGDYGSHKFYGNSEGDEAHAMAVTGSGSVILVGSSLTSWLGGGNAAPKHPHSGGGDDDIAVLMLDYNGAYQWHTFYGAPGSSDSASDVVIDPGFNINISISSDTSWLGDSGAAPLNPHSGGQVDAGVLRLNAAGVYQWHTFLGGAHIDYATGIAMSNQFIYVTGYSNASFLGPGSTPPINSFKGGHDILVFSLSAGTGAYLWHTFHGVAGMNDIGRDIALDSAAYPYVIGEGGDWPGPTGQLPIHEASGAEGNIVVLKLGANGAYFWHTFYGTSCEANAISIQGEAVVGVGDCYAGWNGDGGAAPLNAYTGSLEAFILKLNRSGVYQWHTFMGGSGINAAKDVSIGLDGMIYVAGYGNAWDGPNGQNPAHAHSGGYDATIIALLPSGHYLWHTFYGTNADDFSVGVKAFSPNTLYAVGHSALSWRGDGDAAALHAHSGSGDFFALRLDDLVRRVYAPLVRK